MDHGGDRFPSSHRHMSNNKQQQIMILKWDNMTQKDWENTETTRSYIEVMAVEYGERLLDELLGSTEEEKIRVCTNEDMISEEWTDFQDRNHELVDWCTEVQKTYQSKRILIKTFLHQENCTHHMETS